MTFSDRIGITKPKSLLQTDEIDADLRNGLWQACIEHHIKRFETYSSVRNDAILFGTVKGIFVDIFKKSSDNIPDDISHCIGYIRTWFFKAKWWEVYNFIEHLLAKNDKDFSNRVSFFLEREKSGYRVVNRQLVPITDPIEIAAVSEALVDNERFGGSRAHMRTAVDLFSKGPEPDYRNAIKEAISAVESTARVITDNPKATLGDALRKISDKMALHSALRDAMSKLYGYTSDEGGIRHALLEESNIDEAEAKFMIVACSAFVNFCIQRMTASRSP